MDAVNDAAVPSGLAAPIVAVPLLVRHNLEGVVLYGAHSTGEDIDSNEVRSLEQLSVSAAAAYDHIEAAEYRKQAAEQKSRADELAQRLAAVEDECRDLQRALNVALSQGKPDLDTAY